MSKVGEAIKREAKGLIPELQQRMRDERDSVIREAVEAEHSNNIAIAAMAMLDAGLSDSVVSQMLQKYWDLRLSEASEFLEWAQSQLSTDAKS